MKEPANWVKHDSARFFAELGLEASDQLLDFGCGSGSYSLAAADYLKQGQVYALDTSQRKLRKLSNRVNKQNLSNIETVKTAEEAKLPFESDSFDFIIAYDVIHLLEDRKEVYREFNRVLKTEGTVSIYPTHYQSDSVPRQVAGRHLDFGLNEIIKEVEAESFALQEMCERELIHNRSRVTDTLLQFKKD